MTTAPNSNKPDPDAAEFLNVLSSHTLLLRAIVSLAERGIADQLGTGPATAEELAARDELHAPTLYRLLRFVASYGFFREDDAGRFHLTPRANALRSEVPGSLRDRLRGPWQDLLWQSYARLPDMLRTGEPAFDQAHGQPFFDYLAAQPAVNALLDRNMARVSDGENTLIAGAYDFTPYRRIVDIGGGQGGLLAAILDRYPDSRGILFDQPQVVAAPEGLADSRFSGRWESAPGDFFRSIPPAGDVYLLKRITHDWDDGQVLSLLKNCRAVLREDARLLIIDAIMATGNEPDANKFMDVNLMVLTSGRERTESEFRQLTEQAGMQVRHVISLPPPATLSVVDVALPRK